MNVANNIDFKSEIKKIAKEKNAVILAHYYQNDDIQDIADHIGDSLALAQWAKNTTADIIVLCGVHFMAETAKLLCPEKLVLLPDTNAGCSLADSADPTEFKAFVDAHPDHVVISYVNTSAAIKALTDVVVTSTNAKAIVNSFPLDKKIIFAPDRNLGNYLNSITGRNMVLWDGACHVHEQFSLEKILKLKQEYPKALVLSHPECKKVILSISDFIGSTSALLNFSKNSVAQEFIVATESGILHEMRKVCSEKLFIPAPPNDSSCACNECNFMRLNTLEKLYFCLKNESPYITLDDNIKDRAVIPIERMLKISQDLGL